MTAGGSVLYHGDSCAVEGSCVILSLEEGFVDICTVAGCPASDHPSFVTLLLQPSGDCSFTPVSL